MYVCLWSLIQLIVVCSSSTFPAHQIYAGLERATTVRWTENSHTKILTFSWESGLMVKCTGILINATKLCEIFDMLVLRRLGEIVFWFL